MKIYYFLLPCCFLNFLGFPQGPEPLLVLHLPLLVVILNIYFGKISKKKKKLSPLVSLTLPSTNVVCNYSALVSVSVRAVCFATWLPRGGLDVRKEANKNVLIIIITALLLVGHQRLRCCFHRHSNESRNKK